MQIYTLSFSNNADCKFKISSDYISEQIDINISNYNMEVFVSPLLNNGNQNNVVTRNIFNFKIKLKTLIYIINCIIKNIDNNLIKFSLDPLSIKENIIGELTNNILNKIKDQINSQYIKIYLYNIHKIYYDNFSEKIIFKYIFSNNEINTNNLYDNYKIIISTIRLFNYVISYKTLCNIVDKKLKKNNIDILTILNNDIYFIDNNNIDIKIIVEELYDIEFTTKNEIKYFFVNLI
jgi:hypothetical protein